MVKLAAISIVLGASSFASAQTIYEPLQYQFGRENKYLYGGTDPRVHDLANRLCSPGRTYGRVQGYRWVSKSRVVEREQPRIYADLFPGENAWFYDYSADDAVNDLRARQPRYYRKIDLTADAKVLDDGTLIVPAIPRPPERPRVMPNPARPGEIIIKPSAQPAKKPMIFRFPKELLEKRLDNKGTSSGNLA